MLDFISGVVLFFFGLAVFIASFDYPFGKTTNPGPGFVPRTASIVLMGMSIAILVIVALFVGLTRIRGN